MTLFIFGGVEWEDGKTWGNILNQRRQHHHKFKIFIKLNTHFKAINY